MDRIYFVDKQHELNFKRVLLKWNVGKRDTEYQTACYILSLPMIFEKVEEDITSYEYPTSWIWQYLEWNNEYNEEWDRYDKHPDYEKWMAKKPFDLTGAMVQLGKFSLNMWNSYKDFNLMDCIGALDTNNYNVVKCAMDMRMGAFRE